ncbi:MAG: LytTR family DNA-binding domain-containing protein [Saprospiraceae bacterium]|nr:response regulator transcription factor [Saprospiraceae bacterium]
MNPIRCLVVDDEELARTLLENYIARVPGLEPIAFCANPLEAMNILRKETVDLLFLDIQMPELTGIEFLRTLQQKPVVVFTTAYADYALEGYSLDVTDYLLKPFSFERFLQAVNKAGAALQAKTAAPAPQSGSQLPEKDYLLIKADHKVHRIKYGDIVYIQSMREYVAFHTDNGRILSLNSLKQLEEELPPERFIRVHKSYMVAIGRINTMEGNLLHVGKEKIPVGANYRDALVKRVF